VLQNQLRPLGGGGDLVPLCGGEPVSCNLEHGIILTEMYQIIISLPVSISSCLLAVKFEINVCYCYFVVMILTACFMLRINNYMLIQAPGIESKL